ncbi:MucB/RseB C-terminal domain-containing protein [Methylomonas sp. AM2-LC]|uniref:MucB/RseB C-terminal domain-containing protein n=1 Tax=Methylomonas sp. AM2-LC TaxID=3153301 RepID=UPI00326671DD
MSELICSSTGLQVIMCAQTSYPFGTSLQRRLNYQVSDLASKMYKVSQAIRYVFVFLITAILFVSVAHAEDKLLSAPQLFENMKHALKSLNYQGTVVLMKNGQLDTMRYKHSVVEGVEQERLSSLNSPLREVTRKASEVSCLFKETSQKVINHHPVDSSFIINLPEDSSQIDALYSLAKQGKESIAMLPAEIITIQPKDQLRYSRKVWIESQYFLPLKVEVYDLNGMILEQLVFTDLKVEGINDPNPVVETNETTLQVKHLHASQAEPYENAPFVLKNWPAGFKTLFFIRNSMQQAQKAVEHLLISDGFSSVSIYMEPKEAQGVEGLHSLGSVNSYSKVLDTYQITVLGEVPAQTVEFIATGITLR